MSFVIRAHLGFHKKLRRHKAPRFLTRYTSGSEIVKIEYINPDGFIPYTRQCYESFNVLKGTARLNRVIKPESNKK